jgi:phage terminase large subunit-like protein
LTAAAEESPLERVSRLDRADRDAFFAEEARKHGLTPDQLKAQMLREWRFVGRPKQQEPPGRWTFWFLNAGRGFGKTLTGAQWSKKKALSRRCRFGLIAPTLRDVRATMVEGETGLLSVIPNEALLGQSRETAWNKSLYQLTLANDTIFEGYSSEVPDRLRGPQHDYVWGEEVSSWLDAKHGDAKDSTFSNMKLGLRLGENPQACLTSTPKPNKLTRELVQLAKTGVLVEVKGSSYENRANLSEAWWRAVVEPLEGTRTGRQEIEAELLEDVEGALWTRSMIDLIRIPMPKGWQDDPDLRAEWAEKMQKLAVGLDPNTTSGESADAAGIIVCGLGFSDRLGYVLDDRTQVRGGPKAWAAAAVDAYHDWTADRIVAETNNGGEMVEMVIQGYDPSVTVESVTASRGKRTRAEPISALYESDEQRGKAATIRHVGAFVELEDEMTTWTPADESPNRMDALVWAFWWLKIWRPPSGVAGSHVPQGEIPGAYDTGYDLPGGYIGGGY